MQTLEMSPTDISPLPPRFTGILIRTNQSTAWYKNGLHHREDGPALIMKDGTKFWYRNGLLHRDDGPAVEWADGATEWFRDGKPYNNQKPSGECVYAYQKETYRYYPERVNRYDANMTNKQLRELSEKLKEDYNNVGEFSADASHRKHYINRELEQVVEKYNQCHPDGSEIELFYDDGEG